MEIRRIKKSEWNKILEFNKKEYNPRHILCNKNYYDWQFDDVFNSDTENYTSLGLFDKQDNLVGTVGAFPAPCSFLGEAVSCHWVANLMIEKRLRNLGYGYLLLDGVTEGVDVAVDHDINDAAWALFVKSGWRGADIKRYIGVYNIGVAERIVGRANLGLKILPEPFSDFGAGWNFEKVGRLGAEVDEFWNEIKEKYPISIERSSKYLNWRFSGNSLVDYHIFLTRRDNQVTAMAVLRIEVITEGRTKRETGIKIGRLVDFISTDEAENYTLLKSVEFCRRQGVALIDFFCTGSYGRESLTRAGFVDSETYPYSLIPTLLNPIDRIKRTKHNFAFKIINKFYKNADSENLENWYTVKSCGDQDRPY